MISKPGGKIHKEEMENAFNANDDGAGFAFVSTEGNLVTYKGFRKFEEFWAQFERAMTEPHIKDPESPIVIHFRIATAGKVGVANCHPFSFRDNSAVLAHNGCLWHGYLSDEKSDTREFVERTERYLTEEKLTDPAVLKAAGDAIGSNKLVILYKTKNFVIVNEESGHWDSDKLVWYSNYSYRGYQRTTRYMGGAGGFGTPSHSAIDDHWGPWNT